jgi:hypothetical protein
MDALLALACLLLVAVALSGCATRSAGTVTLKNVTLGEGAWLSVGLEDTRAEAAKTVDVPVDAKLSGLPQ